MGKLSPSIIYTLHGLNSDSGNYARPATFTGIEKYRVDNGRLFPAIVECRVIKTKEELDVLRYVAKVSSDAHNEVGLPAWVVLLAWLAFKALPDPL